MKRSGKKKNKILKRKMINTAFLLIFSVIAVATYYTSNFSRAKDIIEVSVNIKNSLQQEQEKEENLLVNATAGSDGESFYIKLPEYINNKKVIKYSYYIEGETNSEETNTVEEQSINNEIEQTTEERVEEVVSEDEIGPNDVLPESQIYLTSAEIRDKELTILAHYDTKEVNGETLYNQTIEEQKDDSKIIVTGYMPENAKLIIQDTDLKTAQTTIREQTSQPVILAVAYDIKIQVGEQIFEPYELSEKVNVQIQKESLGEKEVNVWHIKDNNQVKKLEWKM